MKGISAIVVTILLVLISISLIGFVFIFFQNTTNSATAASASAQNSTQTNLGKVPAIDNVASTTLVVRNAGGSPITASADLTVYVNGASIACTGGWSVGTLQPAKTSTCTLPAACSGTGATAIKVTAPGGIATTTC